MGCWQVEVLSINHDRRTAQCSWNGNPARTYYEHHFKALRRTKVKDAR